MYPLKSKSKLCQILLFAGEEKRLRRPVEMYQARMGGLFWGWVCGGGIFLYFTWMIRLGVISISLMCIFLFSSKHKRHRDPPREEGGAFESLAGKFPTSRSQVPACPTFSLTSLLFWISDIFGRRPFFENCTDPVFFQEASCILTNPSLKVLFHFPPSFFLYF